MSLTAVVEEEGLNVVCCLKDCNRRSGGYSAAGLCAEYCCIPLVWNVTGMGMREYQCDCMLYASLECCVCSSYSCACCYPSFHFSSLGYWSTFLWVQYFISVRRLATIGSYITLHLSHYIKTVYHFLWQRVLLCMVGAYPGYWKKSRGALDYDGVLLQLSTFILVHQWYICAHAWLLLHLLVTWIVVCIKYTGDVFQECAKYCCLHTPLYETATP